MNLLDDTVEMVRSNKGGAKIIHRGYMYTVHKKKVGGIRWRCARRILHCKVKYIHVPLFIYLWHAYGRIPDIRPF